MDETDPIRRLRAIAGERKRLDEEQLDTMRDARAQGHSWGEIGLALGVTPNAARSWFKRRA
jgi:hypothetical protein